MWAVLSQADKRGGRWRRDEFLATGQVEVDVQLATLAPSGFPHRRDLALDFGCGAGRLSRALARHFDRVIGVDVSASMIATARRLNADVTNIEFRENARHANRRCRRRQRRPRVLAYHASAHPADARGRLRARVLPHSRSGWGRGIPVRGGHRRQLAWQAVRTRLQPLAQPAAPCRVAAPGGVRDARFAGARTACAARAVPRAAIARCGRRPFRWRRMGRATLDRRQRGRSAATHRSRRLRPVRLSERPAYRRAADRGRRARTPCRGCAARAPAPG